MEQNAHIALQTADFGYVLEVGRIVAADDCKSLMQRADIRGVLSGPEGSWCAWHAALEEETIVELTMDQPLTSISALVSQRAASHGGETILRNKNRGIWKTVTWAQLAERVKGIGTALLASGFRPWRCRGDPVGIRPEAVYADLAILGCGAASVADRS